MAVFVYTGEWHGLDFKPIWVLIVGNHINRLNGKRERGAYQVCSHDRVDRDIQLQSHAEYNSGAVSMSRFGSLRRAGQCFLRMCITSGGYHL